MSDFMLDAHELADLGEDLATAGLFATSRAALLVDETLREIVATGRELVPKRSLRLHDSISYERADDGLSGEAGPTKPRGWYGHLVEGGTAHSAPEPFMGPALDVHDGPFVAGIAHIGERIWLG